MTAHPCRHDSFQRGFDSYGVSNSDQRQVPYGRGMGKPSWRERYAYRRTEQPHHQGQNVSSKAAPHQLRAPEQRGMKRSWHAAESSDSPRQDNTKMRPESAGQTLRQEQHGGSGAFAHMLPTAMQGVMKRDGCEAEASVSPSHVNSSEMRLEGSDQPHFQARNGSFGAGSDELPIPEQGGMVINFCEAEASDTLGHHKPQAHQDGSSGATSHELAVPEQRWMVTDLCKTEASDVPYQVQDGSSEAASRGMLLPEQRRTDIDLCEAEQSDIPSQVQDEAASHEMPVTEQGRTETDWS